MPSRTTTATTTSTWGDLVRWGVIAGLIGGIVMAMIMMIVTAALGMGFLTPVYLIAATFHRDWAMTQGLSIVPLLVGLMIHMVNASIFGAIFAVLLRSIFQRSIGVVAAAGAGMFWGLLIFLVMTYAVLPRLDPAMAHAITNNSALLIWWIVGHLMYGVVLGAVVGATAGSTVSPLAGARQRQLA
jgi:hypothetical protein